MNRLLPFILALGVIATVGCNKICDHNRLVPSSRCAIAIEYDATREYNEIDLEDAERIYNSGAEIWLAQVVDSKVEIVNNGEYMGDAVGFEDGVALGVKTKYKLLLCIKGNNKYHNKVITTSTFWGYLPTNLRQFNMTIRACDGSDSELVILMLSSSYMDSDIAYCTAIFDFNPQLPGGHLMKYLDTIGWLDAKPGKFDKKLQ